MPAEYLSPYSRQQFFGSDGKFLSYGTVWTYAAGTTNPIATFTDSTGNTPNKNPITLDANGSCAIFLTANVGYKFDVFDQYGNRLPGYPVDQILLPALLTLFGGVDTGGANQYILTYTSPVPPITDGQAVLWIPANSNTGPSTLNVNNGGPLPILNPDGSTLGANQLIAGEYALTVQINGIWQLFGGAGSGVNVGTFGTETPIPSAATTDLGSVPAHNVNITGTTTITSFGTSAQTIAPIYIGRFTGSLTLTNSAALLLPGGNNIQTSNGDSFIAEYLGNGNWKVLFYQYVSANAATSAIKPVDTTRLSSTTLTADPVLSVNLDVGQYSYQAFLLFDSNTAGAGFKFSDGGTAIDSRGTSPSVAVGVVNAAVYGPKIESFVGNTISLSSVSTTSDSNSILYTGSLLVTTAGTFNIEWAQVVSTATNTTLRAGSYLTAQLLSQSSGTGALVRTYTTPTTAFETIPNGYTNLVIEVFGPSGGGGGGFSSGGGVNSGGGGGGSGGYSRTSISVAGQGGNTILYTVGTAGAPANPGGPSSVASGTFTVATMTANSGAGGGNAPTLAVGGAGGVGGTASGGTGINTTGNTGAAGLNNAGGGAGGIGGAGVSGLNFGGTAGGRGGTISLGFAGGVGAVVFAYS